MTKNTIQLPPSTQARTSPDSRQEKFLELSQKLEQKINAITRIRQILEHPQQNWENLYYQVASEIEDILQSFPQETVNNAKNINHLLKEIRNNWKKFYRHYNNWFLQKYFPQNIIDNLISLRAAKKQKQSVENLQNYERDKESCFISYLIEGLHNLREKSKELEYIRRLYQKYGNDWVRKYIEDHLWIKDPKIKDIEFYWLSVILYLDSVEFNQKISSNAMWINFWNSCIVALKVGQNEEEITKKHENIHNVHSAFENITLITSTELENQREEHFNTILDADANSPEETQNFKNKMEDKIQEFLESLKAELIANFDSLKKWNTNTEEKEIRRMNSFLNSKKENIEQFNKEVSETYQEVISNFLYKIRTIFSCLSDTIYLAEKFWNEEELKSLLYVYQPWEYQKIINYFKRNYWKDTVEFLCAVRIITRERFFEFNQNPCKPFSPENLETLISNSKHQDLLTKEEKEIIIRKIQKSPKKFLNSSYTKAPMPSEFVKNLNKLIKFINTFELDINDLYLLDIIYRYHKEFLFVNTTRRENLVTEFIENLKEYNFSDYKIIAANLLVLYEEERSTNDIQEDTTRITNYLENQIKG